MRGDACVDTRERRHENAHVDELLIVGKPQMMQQQKRHRHKTLNGLDIWQVTLLHWTGNHDTELTQDASLTKGYREEIIKRFETHIGKSNQS
jgi:hypothetical protein